MRAANNLKQGIKGLLFSCIIATTSITWGQVVSAAEGDELPLADKTTLEITPDEVFSQSTGENETFWNPVNQTDKSNWTISAGPTFLSRSRGDKTVLIRNSAGSDLSSTPVFNARDLKFDHKIGYDVDVTRHGEFFDLHANYFAVGGWSTSGGATGPAFILAHLRPGGMIFSGDHADWDYSSTMASGEINLKPHTNSLFTPFTGFRWVKLDEKLVQSDTHITGVLTPKYILETENDLYGIQFGTDVNLMNTSRFQLTGTGIFAIAGNVASNRILSLPAAVDNNLAKIESSGANLAFIFDFALKGKLQISKHVSLSGGYSAMFLSQMALAPAQLEQNQILTAPPFPHPAIVVPAGSKHLETGDYLLVHGGTIQIEATW